VRDLMLARDCADLGVCHTLGPMTSVQGFYQGGGWIALLSVIRYFGGDQLAAMRVIMVEFAFAIATIFVVSRHWISTSVAWAAAAFALGALCATDAYYLLTNPTGAVLPAVLCTAALFLYGLSASRPLIAFAGLCLG